MAVLGVVDPQLFHVAFHGALEPEGCLGEKGVDHVFLRDLGTAGGFDQAFRLFRYAGLGNAADRIGNPTDDFLKLFLSRFLPSNSDVRVQCPLLQIYLLQDQVSSSGRRL